MVEKLDGEFFRWVVGGLLSFIVAIGMLWISKIQGQVDNLTPRITAVEVKEAAIAMRLEKIERKLDLLLEDARTKRLPDVR